LASSQTVNVRSPLTVFVPTIQEKMPPQNGGKNQLSIGRLSLS
jgi:hypothetical protein